MGEEPSFLIRITYTIDQHLVAQKIRILPRVEESAMVAYCLIKFKKGHVWIETNECPSGNRVYGGILRIPAVGGTTKNLIFAGSAEILRGACPEPVEGLRMTGRVFRMESNQIRSGRGLGVVSAGSLGCALGKP